jgi:hypothetical protein
MNMRTGIWSASEDRGGFCSSDPVPSRKYEDYPEEGGESPYFVSRQVEKAAVGSANDPRASLGATLYTCGNVSFQDTWPKRCECKPLRGTG